MTGGRASEDTVLPSRGGLVGPDVLGAERVHPSCIILKSVIVVLILLGIVKLTLWASRTFLGHAALNHVVVVTGPLGEGSASIARGNACVARKVEQLLAEG